MSIAWREAMCVGDPTIDDDHKHLVDMINEFEVAISGHIEHKKVAHVLLGLVEYTGQHFTREEEIQLKIRYPYAESHRRQHRDVLKKLSVVLAEYTASHGEIRDTMIRNMSRFLKEWLVDHIIESDLRMRPYVLKMQADSKDAAKRKRMAAAEHPNS
jgi:hemerythrin